MEKMLSEQNINELRRSLAGTVIVPADAEYNKARRGFNALIDRHPALIVRCVNIDDVTITLGFAQGHELEVAVRGGGHNPAGHCVCDGGLVIDLSQMRKVVVNAEKRIAPLGTARWRRKLWRGHPPGIPPIPSPARPGWQTRV